MQKGLANDARGLTLLLKAVNKNDDEPDCRERAIVEY
jgi:hypothetical protein